MRHDVVGMDCTILALDLAENESFENTVLYRHGNTPLKRIRLSPREYTADTNGP
jgi:hypothetical protein